MTQQQHHPISDCVSRLLVEQWCGVWWWHTRRRDSAHRVVLSTLNLSVLCSHSDMGEAEMCSANWCSLERKYSYFFMVSIFMVSKSLFAIYSLQICLFSKCMLFRVSRKIPKQWMCLGLAVTNLNRRVFLWVCQPKIAATNDVIITARTQPARVV